MRETSQKSDARTSPKKVLDSAMPPKKKSRFKGQDRGKRVRYGKKKIEADKKSGGKPKSSVLSQQFHQRLAEQNKDDNIGIDAANRGSQFAEGGIAAGKDAAKKACRFSKKLHFTDSENGRASAGQRHILHFEGSKEEIPLRQNGSDQVHGVQRKEAYYQRTGSPSAADPGTSPAQTGSNPASRRLQKRNIQKSYVTGKGGPSSAASAGKGSVRAAKEKGKDLIQQVGAFVREHAGLFCTIGVLALILCLVMTQMSSCASMFSGGVSTVLGSSYTAEDRDILGADADYSALEAELRQKIDRAERDHPGYDEYQYHLAEIGHNPYVLASYLTVLFEDYSRDQVQSTLKELFERQYSLTFREEVQIRTRTETRTGHRTVRNEDGTTDREEYEYEVDVEYEYRILHVTLENRTLEKIIDTSGMDRVKQERYALLNTNFGNRPDLFGTDIYANPVPDTDIPEYSVPGEALSDTRFARMVQEAEKYLGYPYVWGGSSPSTSFDCSGFVCWVINHSGNGWNYGRTTAEGLRQQLSLIPASEAKPGDIIFFKGTYNTPGASHVGIYVGGGMMVHCGNPIQYASINTSYWKQHFYCYGRLP